MIDEQLEDDQNPIQQAIEIHRTRIMNVIDRTIDKLELAFCLDTLLKEECKLITEDLTDKELKYIKDMYGKLSKGWSISSTKSMCSNKSKVIKKSSSLESRVEVQCSQMISILHQNDSVMSKVKEILEKRTNYNVEFINLMRELRKYIHKMLRTSATEEQRKNKKIGRMWLNNEKFIKMNSDMEEIRHKQMEELSTKLRQKYEVIECYHKKIGQSQEKCKADINRIMSESERYMYKISMASEENQEFLTEEMKHTTNQYQLLLDTHLSYEKALRVKRLKVETVLAQWLAKYDQDVGGLHMELEAVTDSYNQEKAEFDDLQERFNAQEIEYNILMQEKAEEEERLFQIRRYQFMLTRSVRVIQRYWRKILAKRWRNRKRKRGRKKKK